MSNEPHSAAYFNPQRDFWWNGDYLALLAGRLAFGGVSSALDVGSGVGHWGRLLLGLLGPGATMVGVEREPEWVGRASAAAASAGLGDRCRYVEGDIASLPFAAESFDLVTCQTVLIHVADVPGALREMVRVLRPGGLLLAAEPNNLAGMLVADSVSARLDPQRLAERVALALRCERGKAALGEGDSSIGDLLPGLFAEAGVTGIETYLNDKCFALVPPYDRPDQAALREAIVESADAGRWIWSREEARRYHAAGGGEAGAFDALWERRLEEARESARALRDGSLYTGGGGIQYVVVGRKG